MLSGMPPAPALHGAAILQQPARVSVAPRLLFIDVARALAILGALTAHAVAVFSVWPSVPPNTIKALANALFFTCTPTFFLLFGVMLEVVYVSRCERDGAASVSRRLALRAVQCAAGLALGMVCAWLSGRILTAQLGAALLGMIDTPNSGILRFYAIAMLLSIPVVLLRPRLGPWLPVALITVIWLVAAALPWLPWPDATSRWAFLTGFLFAHPPLWPGGSVWHNLSVVFLGMVLGYQLRQRLARGLTPFGGPVVVVVALAGLVGVALCIGHMGFSEVAHGYCSTGRQLRSAAHPAYFLISTLCAMVLIALAQQVYPSATTREQVRLPFVALGRHSLLTFALGNALLNLYPPKMPTRLWAGVAATVLFLVAICALAQWSDDRSARRRAVPA